MERGRLLSDHRGQPSPRRAESYISARRPATPASGRCSKCRTEASPVGFVRPVRPKRCGSPAPVPTECAAQSASRDGAAFGRKPLRGGRGWPHPPKAGAAKRAERLRARPEAVLPANGRLEARTAFYVRKKCGASETLPASAARRCGSTPSAQGRTDGRPPPVRYRSPANALSRAISSGQRSSSGVSRMSGMSSNRASRAM